MTDKEKKLNEKLGKRIGLEWQRCQDGNFYWVKPSGDAFSPTDKDGIPNFTHSLDACFKWLVPDWIVGITFRFYPGGIECEITYITESGFDTVEAWVDAKSGDAKEAKRESALALCLAIEKLIGEQNAS